MPELSPDVVRVITLLERDLEVTLGDAHRPRVRRLALNASTLDIHDVPEKVVEDVQQELHDLFIDTTWPTCPRHLRHPLWYRDGAWWCEADAVAVAPLGALTQGVGDD